MKNCVSVIIPSVRILTNLNGLIANTMDQTADFAKFEILIINDSGQPLDQISLDLISNANSNGLRVQVLSSGGMMGASYCRNIGIKLATFDNIALWDDDGLFSVYWIENAIMILDKNEDISIFCGKVYAKNPTELLSKLRQDIFYSVIFSPDYNTIDNATNSLIPFYAHAGNSLIRKKLFLSFGFFDEKFRHFTDIEFCYRFYKKERILFCPQLNMIHTHEANLHNYFAKSFRMGHSMLCFNEKYPDYNGGIPYVLKGSLWTIVSFLTIKPLVYYSRSSAKDLRLIFLLYLQHLAHVGGVLFYEMKHLFSNGDKS